MTSIYTATPDMTDEAVALVMVGSPALKERPASEYAAVMDRYNLSRAFCLAVAKKEHDIFRNAVSVQGRNNTRGWSNQRSHQLDKQGTIIRDRIRNSSYARFSTYLLGLGDFCHRITTPTYVYAKEGRTTVAAIIERLAPASDGNDPLEYTRTVEALMRRWRDVKEAKPVPIPPPPITLDHTPSKYGYEGQTRDVRLIVEHRTDHPKGRAGESPSLGWLRDEHPGGSPSCNWLISKRPHIIEIVPPRLTPWTNGIVRNPDLSHPVIAECVRDGRNMNNFCETIEYEAEVGQPITDAQLALGAWLVARRLSVRGLDLDRVIGHWQIDRVDRAGCPGLHGERLRAHRAEIARRLGVVPLEPAAPERGFPGIVLPSGRLQLNGQLLPEGFRLAQAAEVHIIGPNDEGAWYRLIWRNHAWEVEAIA